MKNAIYANGILTDEARRKLWDVEIKILEEIDRICNKYDLQYFLAGGALIGAIRHNGFIPWDDDIDICMLRKDFECFLKVAKIELPEQYFLQNGINQKGYFDTIVRVRDSNTTGIVKKDMGSKCNNGVFVEIYPLDFVNRNARKHYIQLKKIHFYRAILHLDVYGLENRALLKDKVIYILGKIIMVFMKPSDIYEKMQAVCQENDSTNSDYVDELMTKYNCYYRYEDVKNTIYHVFENTEFRIPVGYDNCLKMTYGDYMKLPPEEERIMHHSRDVYYDPYHSYTDPNVVEEAKEYFKGEEQQ